MSASNWVHLDVACIRRETDKAFQVELDNGEITWLPKSQIDDPDGYEAGDKDCTISITEFIAREKGIPFDED